MTMIQTAGLIALFGSLLAVGVPTFLRVVRRSKVAEASTELERIYQSAAAYYLARHGEPQRSSCLPATPAGPTPTAPSVDAIDVAFAAESETGFATWKALGYQPLTPIRYSYSFIPQIAECDPRAHGAIAILRAEGDLDGDGERSMFERRLLVSREHEIVGGDVLMFRDRIE